MTDVETAPGAATIAVWLAGWQAQDDRIDVRVGQRVAWTLTDDDLGRWIDLLFDGARSVDLAVALDESTRPGRAPVLVDVTGTVRAVEAVSCRHVAGGEAERGSATATAVRSTLDALASGPLASIDPTGFIITLELDRA